jgi:GT2 family glycosyltransferase
MQLPTLSVVIPTKDEERYLPRLLAALRSQTHQPQEIIVADAQSTDATRSLAEQAGAKVVEGGNPSVGRNNGAKAATGDWILFLDADAILNDERFIEKGLQEAIVRGFTLAAPDIYLENGGALDRFGHHFYNWYVRLLGSLRPHVPGFCIFVTRAMFEKVQGFDPTVVFCEDQEFAIRAVRAGARLGFLDSIEVGVTDRRMRRDGSIVVGLKLILAEMYMLFFGPIRTDLFRYHFGYPKDKK